ncbi:hypothetical protein G647_01553 [Cladophialophora carrionii CBS 160.54]|uniref:Uncharacterized protein n=1 Tax=Cladophialophora carrionii CBS 160.54 TaxID=1279043 RepID=V9DQE0_9EURO|nr:uncharacterized protein G647_01553 [Cladophialophora carrionii CBS 160.54]ETI29100.1 hypothetical protein G647_01553 [Cladophialophora carrionii CBS 160.54]
MALSASVLAGPIQSSEPQLENGEGPAGICFGGCGPGIIKREPEPVAEPEPVPKPQLENGEGPAGICFGGCGPGIIKRDPEESSVATF